MKTERELYQEHYKTSRDYKFYIKHEMTEKQVFEFKDGKYVVECVNDGWKIWQASAQREGYKLVPVDSLKIVLNCIDQDNLFFINGAFKALDDVEKAMIGASE